MTEDLEPNDRTLWLAVIQQTILDASGPVQGLPVKKQEAIRAEARAWLLEPNHDFEEVCELADVDPDETRARARYLIEHADRTGTRHKEEKRKAPPPKTSRLDQLLTHEGETLSVRQWLERTGTSQDRFNNRVQRGWSMSDALFKAKGKSQPLAGTLSANSAPKPAPASRARTYTHNGLTLTAEEWAKRLGIPYRTIKSRLAYKWPLERVFTANNYRGKPARKTKEVAIAA